ncbi:MAG TPA: VWA domain-containing protein [Vicinamibacterales bacterium]|nr:VWA domain-containing protein [Vicinamibacterales bacterium]
MVILALGASVLVAAQSQKPPVFRGRIDLMQLDVTVLDKNGVPVRGLTKDDFTLLEDKTQQTIEAFKAVDLPDRVIAGPAWADKVPADVTTNEMDNARIFVLVIDDGFGMGGPRWDIEMDRAKNHNPDPWAIKTMRQSAELFINSLGAQDLAGLVYTGTTSKFSQNLTSDRAKLMKSLDAYPANDSTLWLSADPGAQCLAHKEILRLMEAVVNQLASLPDRRKSILYFGGQMPWADHAGGAGGDPCGTYWMWQDVFTAAQQGSVTINPIQTGGLKEPIDSYLSVADYTGGHAVVNTNDFAPGIKRIFLENSSYYLLAYQPTKDLADGTFRRITVTVKNRPDVEIITKRNYWAPRAPKPGEPEKPPPSEQVKALAGLLPDARLPLRVSAAPFAVPGSDAAVIALSLGIRQPAFAGRTPDQIELLLRSFTATGDPTAGDDQVVPITVPAAPVDSEISRYEVLARLDVLKPGPYHLRLSAHSVASDTRGSVYIDVDVPNFRKDKVSLSGIVLNSALGAVPVAPLRLLRDIVPVVPTTERAFVTSDIVMSFLRVYQGAGEKIVSVPLKISIQDAAGKSVFTKTETLAADRFSAEHSADYQFRLPLATLKGGEYLLTFETTVGKVSARRDVRFTVR